MHRTSIACLVALFVISIPYLSLAVGFGGLITFTQPCDEGLLLYIDEPMVGIIPYMWYVGELPFAFYVPPHIGQFLIGDAFPTPANCTIDGETVGEGFPILYHGDSM